MSSSLPAPSVNQLPLQGKSGTHTPLGWERKRNRDGRFTLTPHSQTSVKQVHR
jgi:hypothetical protein